MATLSGPAATPRIAPINAVRSAKAGPYLVRRVSNPSDAGVELLPEARLPHMVTKSFSVEGVLWKSIQKLLASENLLKPASG